MTVGLVVLFLISAPHGAAAASIACTTSDLVAAVNSANGTPGATITLAAGCVYTLTAANNSTDGGTGLPVITGNFSVAGNGATITRSAASGTPTFRIFDVAGSGSLTLDSLTISNGLLSSTGSTGGAGIYNHGTLSVSGSTFAGNSSPSPNGVSGGAISNSGQLTVTTSTFTNNSAQEGASIFNQNMATVSQTTFANNNGFIYGGGGVLNAFGTTNVDSSLFVGNLGRGGGAIDNDTTMTVRNSTFYNNSDNGSGGGAVNNFGTMTFIQTTFSGNKAGTGANIHNYSSGSVTASTTLVMTILANPVGGSNCATNGRAFIDNGYNLASDSSCGLSSAQHSLSSTDPQLAGLASNGGPTQTMAIPPTSPAIDPIPTSFNGCSGSTDQRGVTRPQGAGCDIGAFETIIASNDTLPPTVPAGLSATSVSATSVSLSWNQSTDDVAVTGYTVYRNGSAIGSTGSVGATTYADETVSPSTTYSYTVDAFDAGGLHSAQSPPLSVTTSAPAAGVRWKQSAQIGTGSSATSATLTLSGAVNAGDLLVGWFGQYNSGGQVNVSDNVNGPWIRGASETWSSSSGDLALYYVQNSQAAPNGVNITITSTSPTYLEAAAGDYSGVALTGALDTASVAKGVGTAVDSGATAPTGAGELVVGGIITGGSPGSVTPGTSQGRPFTMRAQRPSGSVDIEDVLSSAAGTQNGRATFGSSTDWYAVGAVFHQLTNADAQPPTVPAGLTATASSSPLQVTLAWNASTDNVGVTGYTIQRNGAVLTSVSGSTLSYVDTTVTGVATYMYAVDAFDAAGNHSAQSSGVTVTTPGVPDTQPPTIPTGVAAKAGPVGEVDVSWLASTDNVAVTGYTVYRGGVALGTVSGSTLTYADKTAAGATTYVYAVDAFDAAANHSNQSLPATITTPDWSPPTTPAGLTATVINNGEIDLSWNASTDNTGVTGYTVYRNGSAIGTTGGATLTYPDKTAGHGFTYSYTVDAVDAAGNHSPQSATASATTVDDIVPTTPGAFNATAASATSVTASWSASTDNVGVAGYDVYRDSAFLIQVGASTLTYLDTVGVGSTHTYTVDAVDAAGNHSPLAAPVTVTTPSVVITPSYVQGSVLTTGSRVTSVTVSLGPVAKGDLLVGLFGQYDSTGSVGVSDNVNGAWTRSASTTWRGVTNNPGDIALYYFANAAAAPGGLTITVTSTNATYLQASVAEYSGVAAVNPLDQVVIAKGSSASADSGVTAAVGAGELVYGAMVATNSPGNLSPSSSQGLTFVKRGQSSSGTQGEEDIVSSAAGQQHAGFTFPSSGPWFMVCAVFRHG